jgi:hypothetical protein
MPRAFVAAVLVLALTAPAHALAATSAARRANLGPVLGGPVSDGSRWAAWQPHAGVTEILDVHTASHDSVATPAGCDLGGIGAGELVWTCNLAGAGLDYPLLLDLATFRIHDPPGLAQLLPGGSANDPDALGTTWSSIGGEWIAGEINGYHYAASEYLNWHTGKVLRDTYNRYRRIDVDSRTLTRTVCSPLARPTNPDDIDGPPLLDYYQAGPFAVDEPSSYDSPLLLRRCGTHRVIRVASCPNGCDSIELTPRALTWTEQGRAYAYTLPAGPRRRLHVAGYAETVLQVGPLILASTSTRRPSSQPPQLIALR